MSAQEILEHSFLAVEPEVVLLATDATKKQLTLQVVFKGMDRLSVKFEFNSDTDTAEEVVNEMVRVHYQICSILSWLHAAYFYLTHFNQSTLTD